jgi:hypothetical protein
MQPMPTGGIRDAQSTTPFTSRTGMPPLETRNTSSNPTPT